MTRSWNTIGTYWALAPRLVLAAVILQALIGVLIGILLIVVVPAVGGWGIVVAFGLCVPVVWSGAWLLLHSPVESIDPLPDVVRHHTERLEIRRIERDDAAAYGEAMDETALIANGWTPKLRAITISLVEAPSPVGRRCQLVLTTREGGEPVAFASITDRSPPGVWSIGMWVTPSRRGQGFGTEALAGVLEVVHDAGIAVAHIGTAVDNLPMQATIERAGCHLVDTRPHELPNGTIIDSRWYTHNVDGPGVAD